MRTVDVNAGSTERPSERELGLSPLNKKTVCSLRENAEIVPSVSDMTLSSLSFGTSGS